MSLKKNGIGLFEYFPESCWFKIWYFKLIIELNRHRTLKYEDVFEFDQRLIGVCECFTSTHDYCFFGVDKMENILCWCWFAWRCCCSKCIDFLKTKFSQNAVSVRHFLPLLLVRVKTNFMKHSLNYLFCYLDTMKKCFVFSIYEIVNTREH